MQDRGVDAGPAMAGDEALARGRAALQAGDRAAAARWLQAALRQPEVRLAAHNLIERHGLEGAFGAWMGLNCEIALADDIFGFFATHPSSLHPLRDYLADGWRTLSELLLLMEKVGQPLLGCDHVLEFASGHGRFTRHLVKALGPRRVTVSDVVPDAVRFSRAAFGVEGFVSATEPEAVRWPRQYALVFVLSLFSHLPAARWGRWLTALWQAVAPGGWLVFSTDGQEAARRAAVRLDAQGYHFTPASESTAIDPEDYGTTYTSEAFVRARIAACVSGLAGPPAFAPTWFWHHQDAWALRREIENERDRPLVVSARE